MVEAVQAGTVVAAQTAAQSKPTRGVPDTPAREKAAAAATTEAVASAKAPGQGELLTTGTDTEATPKPQVNLSPRSSALTTYRDSDSGRLIVRIFDEESGEVLVEFPPEDPPQGVSVQPSPTPGRPQTTIDV